MQVLPMILLLEASPENSPEGTPSGSAESEWVPQGEAYAVYEDDGGLHQLDGKLSDILAALIESQQTDTTVYLLTDAEITVRGIAPEQWDALDIRPDPETFKSPKMTYTVHESVEDASAEGEYPAVTLWVEATPVQEETEEPDTPEETEEPAWVPQGEAYAVYEDDAGLHQLDGELMDILQTLIDNQQTGTVVYLLTDAEITVHGIAPEQWDALDIRPAPESFSDAGMDYAVFSFEEEPVEGEAYPPVTLWVETMPKETESPAPEETETPAPEETETPAPEETETPAPEETPAPALTIGVQAENYTPGVWSSTMPVFTLSGITEGDDGHVYGVFVCDEQLILLSKGNSTYQPTQEGEVSLRFAIFDRMGDVVSLSDQYDMLLDVTPPDGPYYIPLEYTDTMVELMFDDMLSGVDAVTLDGGGTWQTPTSPMYLSGSAGDTIPAGRIGVRDVAGNVSFNYEELLFGPLPTPRPVYTGKRIKHVPETMDYSTANYNALDLEFSSEPSAELWAGDTQLALTLRDEAENNTFTAALTTWQSGEDEEVAAPNALLLCAQEQEGVNVWSFTGDVYRLLYNSGVEYIVFRSGDYIAALPTEGFTAGTAYAKLKASGVSTRKFAYTLCQDEALRETTLSVTVEEETYLMEEDRNQPMYRYDVLVGDVTLMDKPYSSYLPKDEEP